MSAESVTASIQPALASLEETCVAAETRKHGKTPDTFTQNMLVAGTVLPPMRGMPAPGPARPVAAAHFLCEDDVRRAVCELCKVFVGPKTIVTPSVRDYANQYDVLIATAYNPPFPSTGAGEEARFGPAGAGGSKKKMTQNLNTLRTQIQEYLESRGLVVFHGFLGTVGSQPCAYWDSVRRPDYHEFVAAAEACGARLLTMFTQEFSAGMVDDAEESLAEAGLERDEHRALESRLREMRAYDGFTCSIELNFDHAGRVYVFDVRTDWFDEFNEMQEHIDAMSETDDADDDDDHSPLGGGDFSRN